MHRAPLFTVFIVTVIYLKYATNKLSYIKYVSTNLPQDSSKKSCSTASSPHDVNCTVRSRQKINSIHLSTERTTTYDLPLPNDAHSNVFSRFSLHTYDYHRGDRETGVPILIPSPYDHDTITILVMSISEILETNTKPIPTKTTESIPKPNRFSEIG